LRHLKKYFFHLSILEIIVLSAGILFLRFYKLNLTFADIILLSGFFTINTAIALFIFFRGQERDPESQTMHSLVAVSLKFLVELFIAFVWFFISKKSGLQSVILFFVLYLTFTLFSVLIILKTLKYKTL
jgi:hypothetical protein